MLERGRPFPPQDDQYVTLYCPSCKGNPPLKCGVILCHGPMFDTHNKERMKVPFYAYKCQTPGCGYAENFSHRLKRKG